MVRKYFIQQVGLLLMVAVIIMISMYVTRRLDKGDDSVRAKRGGNVQ